MLQKFLYVVLSAVIAIIPAFLAMLIVYLMLNVFVDLLYSPGYIEIGMYLFGWFFTSRFIYYRYYSKK